MDINERAKLEKELANYEGEDEIVSSIELLDKLTERRSKERKVSMTSGFPEFDESIQSFDGGELTIISGDTGQGKTLLSQSLTEAFVKQNKYVLWFSFEVQALQFLNQFSQPVPAFLMPNMITASSMDWIRKRAIEAKLKFGLDAMFIDHLHFLLDMGGGRGNVSLEIGAIMRALKRLALELDVAMFVLAHTNRDVNRAEPDISSIRDSSMAACEADNVFFVWRLVNTDNQAIVKIAKNRKFGVMNKKFKLQKQGRYLRECYEL